MDDERPESDIRRRAAWLLAMLAVVAGLFVLISLTLFNTSGRDSNDGEVDDLPTDVPTTSAPATSGPASMRPDGAPSTSPVAGSSSATSSAAVPKPSCPGSTTCAVQGDVGGAMTAINTYRSQHGKKAVPTTSTPAAARCAVTDGGNCPTSFVWVRVDDLSGSGVVKGVTGFHSNDDLLDNNATSFEVGWAYNPGSRTVSCALIRND